MIIKECYVSKNGISCISNINTLTNLKLNNNNFLKYLYSFLILRTCEYIINDITNNINYFNDSIKNRDDFLLTSIIFN